MWFLTIGSYGANLQRNNMKTYSQAKQDIFVINYLKEIKIGYKLERDNVSNDGYPFEDWYVLR